MSNAKARAYVEERNAALLGSLEAFATWAREKSGMSPEPHVIEISYHQLRTAARSLPMEARSLSKHWLLQNDLRPWDDGDVP